MANFSFFPLGDMEGIPPCPSLAAIADSKHIMGGQICGGGGSIL